MDEATILDVVVRRVLFRVGNMEREELNSFITYGQNVYDTYKNVILPNSYLNKYLEPQKELPPERQQALLLALTNLHGMYDKEIRIELAQNQQE